MSNQVEKNCVTLELILLLLRVLSTDTDITSKRSLKKVRKHVKRKKYDGKVYEDVDWPFIP